MKRFFSFLIFGLLLISCSDNDSQDDFQFPEIDNISVQTATIGDAITINGSGFQTNENYVVWFNGTEALILEVNPDFLKVEVPEGATSGDITLSVNGETRVIGKIDLNAAGSFVLYAFKGDDETNSSVVPSIVKIDPANGNETTVASLSEYISDLAFNNATGEIYGIGEDNKLVKVDIVTGTFSTVNLDNSLNIFYELITDDQNNIYAFKGDDEINSSVVPSIVKMDPANGNETSIATLSEYISDLAFNNNTREVYGIGWEDNKLFKVEITSGTVSTVNLDNSSNVFYELIMDDQNNLYAFKGDDETDSAVVPSIVKIDPANGNESTIATLPEYISDLTFNNETKEIYGIGWEDNKLYKIHITNGTVSSVNLDNSSNIFYELVIM